MEFLIKVAITAILVVAIFTLVPTGIGIILAYPLASVVKAIWNED